MIVILIFYHIAHFKSAQVRTYNEPLLKYSLLNADEVMKRITKRMTEPCYLEEEVFFFF